MGAQNLEHIIFVLHEKKETHFMK